MCIPYSIKVKLQLCFVIFLPKAKQNKSLPVSCSKQIQAEQVSAWTMADHNMSPPVFPECQKFEPEKCWAGMAGSHRWRTCLRRSGWWCDRWVWCQKMKLEPEHRKQASIFFQLLHIVKQKQKLINQHSIVFFCFNTGKIPKWSMHLKTFTQFLHFQANMLLHFCSVPLSLINLQENTEHFSTLTVKTASIFLKVTLKITALNYFNH